MQRQCRCQWWQWCHINLSDFNSGGCGYGLGGLLFPQQGPTMAAMMTAATGRLHSGRRRAGFSCASGGVTSGSLTITGGCGSGSAGLASSTTGVNKGASASAKVISGDFFFLFRLCYGNDRRNIGKSQAIEHIVAGFSFRLTKPQNVITGLPSTRNTWFSPGNWMVFRAESQTAVGRFFPTAGFTAQSRRIFQRAPR